MLRMKSIPPGLSLLILIISTSFMFGLGSVVRKTYTHVCLHYTWEEARNNCKSTNSYLAFIQTEEDKRRINFADHYSWIGLTKDNGSGVWMWGSGSTLNYGIWPGLETNSTDSCASISFRNKRFFDFPCENYFFFYCEKSRNFTFINESKTHEEAQEYCKQHDEILATFSAATDLYYVRNFEFSLWIDTGNAGSNRTGSLPDQSDNCVTITTQTKTMAARNCSDHFPSVCMTDNVILIKENKTWEGAMKYCRELVLSTEDKSRYELVSVEAGNDDTFLRAKASYADTEQVWVGLRFLGRSWFWINGVSMRYPELGRCPKPGKNCGVISKTTAHLETADCGEKKNFLCYKL